MLANRELSWLSFNYRVLQEAKDPNVPLYERIKFIAIYSSNLDEFYRVRVASLRGLLSLKKKSLETLDFDPAQLLKQIQKTVHLQLDEYGDIFRNEIIPALNENNIYLVEENNVTKNQLDFINEYFDENVVQHIQPVMLVKKKIKPFLRNARLYIAVKLATKKKTPEEDTGKKTRHSYAIVEIPTNHLPRFVELPSENNKHCYMFLDDIVRACLPEVFNGYKIVSSHSIKLTRDAELYIDDEFSGNLLNKIEKGLKKRNTGPPARFLYDCDISKSFLKFLKESLKLSRESLMPGGKYHNLNDLFSFPNPGRKDLENKPLIQLRRKEIDNYSDIYEAIIQKDFAFYFPYHTFDHVLEFFNKAADDPSVKSIKLTQYRVASRSEIINAIIRAAKKGKDVMVFVEVKARFDEEANIRCAEKMEKAGIRVYYSFPGLKVHSKIAIIKREENGVEKNYCYLGTGNFNEKTAKIYSDIGLFTSDIDIAEEIEKVFIFLEGKKLEYKFKHLLVAQFNMRKIFNKLIDNEINLARQGKKAKIILKMNSIEDKKIIIKLYEASKEGVKIYIIVRGICCLVPGIKGLSENIYVISILDRYLEHARVFIFNNNGDEKIYLSSADWMKRNLSRRIEVGFPIYDEEIKNEIKHIIQVQLNDNTKARKIDKGYKNKYQKNKLEPIRSQLAIYDYLRDKNN